MREFDVIVIGSGAGMNVAARARAGNLSVALVEDGPLGGTCLNRGCIPSKVLIEPATIAREIEDAKRIGVFAKVERMDFEMVRTRMWDLVLRDRKSMERGVASDKELGFYPVRSYFIGPKTMQCGSEQIHAPKIIISAGVRTNIPPIPGLEAAKYQTSETIFDLARLPRRLAIVGGGYKACEFAHFFSAFGVEVTIIGHNPLLLPREEPEISELVRQKMSEIADIRVNQEISEVKPSSSGKVLVHRDRGGGEQKEVEVDEILLATGVRSNADLLRVTETGVAISPSGYIMINEFMETSVPGIWAFGDIIGRNMFRHTANYEADIVWYNAFGSVKVKLDEHAVPHAVFAYPEVGSVGMTEAQAKARGRKYFVGFAPYDSTAKGFAMADEDSFVKVIVDAENMRILGAHIVGPHASILVQSLVYLMNSGDQTYMPLARSQTIHPALSEVVVNAFGNLMDPDHHHEHEH
ncbi:MAG: dihydrolipoyl dehydrogenase [Methanomassiliicoccales archaeon]|nr:dihydrolipoyl dehydrogenase [Methanomassiliicoccales archaeon]